MPYEVDGITQELLCSQAATVSESEGLALDKRGHACLQVHDADARLPAGIVCLQTDHDLTGQVVWPVSIFLSW